VAGLRGLTRGELDALARVRDGDLALVDRDERERGEDGGSSRDLEISFVHFTHLDRKACAPDFDIAARGVDGEARAGFDAVKDIPLRLNDVVAVPPDLRAWLEDGERALADVDLDAVFRDELARRRRARIEADPEDDGGCERE